MMNDKKGESNMKQYIGTKIIKAKPMTRGEYNDFRGWKVPADEDYRDKGFLVEYSDGYISWSPEKQFNDAYRECNNMTFGLAIEALKKGLKVARKGWNGKNQYIELANNISYKNSSEEIVNCNHDAIGNKAIAFVGTSGVQMGWLASQSDMLAEDWYIKSDGTCKDCRYAHRLYEKCYECTKTDFDMDTNSCFEPK